MTELVVKQGDNTELDCYRPPITVTFANSCFPVDATSVEGYELTVKKRVRAVGNKLPGFTKRIYKGPPVVLGDWTFALPNEVWDEIHASESGSLFYYDITVIWNNERRQTIPSDGYGEIQITSVE